jgi:hypothetical protein
LPTAHTAAFKKLYTAVGNGPNLEAVADGAVSCLSTELVFFSVGKGAKKAPRYWKSRKRLG